VSFNVFSFIFGDPSPKVDRAAFQKALTDLKNARIRNDKVAIAQALSRMQAASAKLSTASKKAISTVNTIDKTVASVKSIGIPSTPPILKWVVVGLGIYLGIRVLGAGRSVARVVKKTAGAARSAVSR